MFRSVLAAALLAASLGLAATPAVAKEDPIYTGSFSNVAVSGYDPVAYFADSKPVKGNKANKFEWMGAEWHFATPENLEKFKADPAKYAPQYGGYCAYAVALGKTASADPEAWKIIDGKLYLNYDKDIQAKWEKDVPGYLAKSEQNWPKVLGN